MLNIWEERGEKSAESVENAESPGSTGDLGVRGVKGVEKSQLGVGRKEVVAEKGAVKYRNSW